VSGLLSNLISNPRGIAATLGAPASLAGLPVRVAELVKAQDLASERLIIRVQLALALALSMLYVLAPRPADAPMHLLAAVPLALMCYLAFVGIRFALSLRGPLPGWFIIPSIVADMGLLIGLIWAFHLEYGQPAGFSFKVPTFAYLFVFIALRALRFDHRYVLAAGLAAALGWLALLVAAVMSDPNAVTHNFVEYVAGTGILVGAEIDKIIAILIVTAVLTLGAMRAQRTLIAAVREEAAVKEIRRFLSKGVADQISRAETLIEAGHAVERDAAIMMLDIRGFTPFAMRVPPADVVKMLTSFHARIVPIVRGNGGVIDKFLGDGVMATFGAVEPSPEAAANALRALDLILEEAAAWQASLKDLGLEEALHVNAAVAAGPVVFATLGDGDRLEYTVIGEAVNLAAKLEKHNKAEKSRAVFPAATFLLAMRQGYQPAAAPVPRRDATVLGVSQPIDLYAWLT
jgi:adenylate cyclase